MSDWKRLADYLHDEIGYAIEAVQFHRLERQIPPILEQFNLDSVDALVLRSKSNATVFQALVNAVTINESYFFRESRVWDDVEEHLIFKVCEHLAEKNKLRILVCACSNGQEVYTISIILKKLKHLLPGIDWEILGTDIDTSVLECAAKAEYSAFEVNRGFDEETRRRCFVELDGGRYRVIDELRSHITFRHWNVFKPLDSPHVYDLVFCRNMLIYFSDAGKKQVLGHIERVMQPCGYLALGSTEFPPRIEGWTQEQVGSSRFLKRSR